MRRTLAVAAASLLLALPGAEAAPASYTFPVMSGKLVRLIRYRDAAGDMLLVATQSPVYRTPPAQSPDYPTENQEIEASAYRLLPDGSAKHAWSVRDHVRRCDLETSAAFRPDLIEVTDVNGDGVAEVWLPYVLSCRSDPGPAAAKIIMREGDRKYAVRGETQYREGSRFIGGDGKLDMEGASPEAVTYAKRIWRRLSFGGVAR